ncbi:hypothetical protein GDI3026 [Gluconacetobacter diazotrophicus PA1 5]|uniref:Uncharacterized protein n=1 Tax=Gluconacetobacter diazotrophicus (strain ATCC 49037 / DSM 5601 / CCUG 37298 / CIP 103539 / LMG 7603 / PAl5) TaxID=272568 RepID=A9HRR9_GLUDA|nr:hypothetical protein GDI3026 [Gluconacetobacter diazotrophicus PA1 5]
MNTLVKISLMRRLDLPVRTHRGQSPVRQNSVPPDRAAIPYRPWPHPNRPEPKGAPPLDDRPRLPSGQKNSGVAPVTVDPAGT